MGGERESFGGSSVIKGCGLGGGSTMVRFPLEAL